MLHLASQGCIVDCGGVFFLSMFAVLVITTFFMVICVILCCICRTFEPFLLNEKTRKTREVMLKKKTAAGHKCTAREVASFLTWIHGEVEPHWNSSQCVSSSHPNRNLMCSKMFLFQITPERKRTGRRHADLIVYALGTWPACNLPGLQCNAWQQSPSY